MAPDPRAVAQIVAVMTECAVEDAARAGHVDDGRDLDDATVVDAALWIATRMLWLAHAGGAGAGRSQRWVASVERLALQVDGLRRREGA